MGQEPESLGSQALLGWMILAGGWYRSWRFLQMREAYRVLIADGHALLRQGISALLREHPDLVVVGEAASAAEALEMSRQLQPNVVLVDAELPSSDGFQATRQIRAELQDARVIVLSIRDNCPELVYSAIRAGALGFVTKTSEIGDLVAAIRSVGSGQASIATGSLTSLITALGSSDLVESGRSHSAAETLTEREQEVLALVTEGHSNREIASLLCISESTVRSHLHNILDKLHLSNRVQAATYALTSRQRPRDLPKPNGRTLGPAGSVPSVVARDGRGSGDLARSVPAVLPRYQTPGATARPRRVPEAT
jgi:DNA-binding NarL/FixJ family response regulator